MSLEKAVLGSLLLTLASTTSFFPRSLRLELSEKALERAAGNERPDAGVVDGAQLLKQFEWALLGMKEQPLWSRAGLRSCRMLAMLHRSCLVLRVDELAQGSGQLVAKRYDQGSSPEGVRVSASGTVALEQEALRAMQTAFTDTGLFSRSGFWKNTAYRDGEVDPFTGAFLFECGGGGRYGMAVFEPPLAGAGEEGRHAQEVVDQGLRLIGTDFLSAGQLGEYVR